MATLCTRLEWDNAVRSKWESLDVFSSLYLARLTVHIKTLKVGVLECIFIITSTCRKAHNNQSLCQLLSWTQELIEYHARAAAKMFKSTCLRLLAISSVLTATSTTDAWQKIIVFSIFQNKLVKVRESLHLPCSQQSFSLQQLAPPWQTNALLLVEVEEEEEATSAVQQVAWVDFKDQNWWCSRLPKCNHGGEKYSPLCSLLKPPPRSSKPCWGNTA